MLEVHKLFKELGFGAMPSPVIQKKQFEFDTRLTHSHPSKVS